MATKVPAVKRSMEKFIFCVKALLHGASNGSAFWMGKSFHLVFLVFYFICLKIYLFFPLFILILKKMLYPELPDFFPSCFNQ